MKQLLCTRDIREVRLEFDMSPRIMGFRLAAMDSFYLNIVEPLREME